MASRKVRCGSVPRVYPVLGVVVDAPRSPNGGNFPSCTNRAACAASLTSGRVRTCAPPSSKTCTWDRVSSGMRTSGTIPRCVAHAPQAERLAVRLRAVLQVQPHDVIARLRHKLHVGVRGVPADHPVQDIMLVEQLAEPVFQ